MIVVEGPDGAGKTTLIHTLQQELDLPVAPRVVSKDAEAMVDLMDWVDDNLARGFQQTIFDRHRLISEPIYGPILRSSQAQGFTELSWLAPRLQQFYALRPIVIYCLPPLEIVRDNVIDDPDNKVVESNIDAIYTAYVNRAALDLQNNSYGTFVWDYARTLQINGKPAWFHRLATRLALGVERMQ